MKVKFTVEDAKALREILDIFTTTEWGDEFNRLDRLYERMFKRMAEDEPESDEVLATLPLRRAADVVMELFKVDGAGEDVAL